MTFFLLHKSNFVNVVTKMFRYNGPLFGSKTEAKLSRLVEEKIRQSKKVDARDMEFKRRLRDAWTETENMTCVKLDVFVGLFFQIKQTVDALLDVIEGEAQPGSQPKTHETFCRGGRCGGQAEQLERGAEGRNRFASEEILLSLASCASLAGVDHGCTLSPPVRIGVPPWWRPSACSFQRSRSAST
jgi:hypothetical protein